MTREEAWELQKIDEEMLAVSLHLKELFRRRAKLKTETTAQYLKEFYQSALKAIIFTADDH